MLHQQEVDQHPELGPTRLPITKLHKLEDVGSKSPDWIRFVGQTLCSSKRTPRLKSAPVFEGRAGIKGVLTLLLAMPGYRKVLLVKSPLSVANPNQQIPTAIANPTFGGSGFSAHFDSTGPRTTASCKDFYVLSPWGQRKNPRQISG